MDRRELMLSLAAATAGAAAPWPVWAQSGPGPGIVGGVRLGVTTASLNPLPQIEGSDPLDVLVRACAMLGVWGVELAGGFFGPAVKGAAVGGQTPKAVTPEYQASREALRQWRLSPASLERFAQVRDAFARGRVNLYSMSNTISDDCTDAEIDAMFRQMQVLGVKLFQTNQTRVETGLRLGPFAEKYKITPAFHTHSQTADPNEIASVDSLTRLLAASPTFRVCLDIGHFTAGNNDAVSYLREHHARITHIHVKDRKRDNGPNVQWGTGDTPIGPCLKLIRDNGYPIPCLIEREFKGEGTAFDETLGNLNYMRDILAKPA
jgi:sugar phosphate isomerase/epimerase